jgi:hypothetical protein
LIGKEIAEKMQGGRMKFSRVFSDGLYQWITTAFVIYMESSAAGVTVILLDLFSTLFFADA